jgi:hypothetical protein
MNITYSPKFNSNVFQVSLIWVQEASIMVEILGLVIRG